jgi:hypothetical protein
MVAGKERSYFAKEVPMKTARVLELVSPAPVPRPLGVEEEIRCRAYQLYEERGKTDGYAVEDWCRAEKEIMTHQVRQKAS